MSSDEIGKIWDKLSEISIVVTEVRQDVHWLKKANEESGEHKHNYALMGFMAAVTLIGLGILMALLKQLGIN